MSINNKASSDSFYNKLIYLAALAFLFLSGCSCQAVKFPKSPPDTRKEDIIETIHGVEVTDPFRWLENGDSTETREWIKAQNEYTDAIIKSPPFREKLKSRITRLLRIDRVGSPVACRGRYFFHKRKAQQELSVICMRKGFKGKDQVLIDPHPLSPDHSVKVSLWGVSEDGTMLAYAVRRGGRDEVTVKFFDVEERNDLAEYLPESRYTGFSIRPDKTGCYYVRHESEGPRVYYHKIGTDTGDDKMIFGCGYGPDKIMWTQLSEDGRYLLVTVFHGSAGTKSEIYLQDTSYNAGFRPVVKDVNARFTASISDKHLFIRTNHNAPNEQVFRTDLENLSRENRRKIIPESDSVIESLSLAGGKLFANYTKNVTSHVKVYDINGRFLRDIKLPGHCSAWGPRGRWDSTEAFFGFSSFHIPPTTYRYDTKTGQKQLWWQADVPIDSSKFEVKQIWYESRDSTRVPMFIVHNKDIDLDGNNPTLLTGYGGFNHSLTPTFSTMATLWIEAGGVFARPNLRGGGEFGEKWHQAGMLENKQKVFDDFVGAAEWLIKNGYTRPEKLAISGRSNGGLLVGAALTQRPELFGAVVCGYPLLDMLRYHKFLVARFWISEYGSAENPEQFRYLYDYSPYHNVTNGVEYPAVLFITGDGDTRVAPLHARKMTALLQSATGSKEPVILRYHTKAGHSGGRAVKRKIEDLTDEYSFLFSQLNMRLNRNNH